MFDESFASEMQPLESQAVMSAGVLEIMAATKHLLAPLQP